MADSGDIVTVRLDMRGVRVMGIAAAVLLAVLLLSTHTYSTSNVRNMIARRATIRGAAEAAADVDSDRCLALLFANHFPGDAQHPGSGWFYVDDKGDAVEIDGTLFPLRGEHEVDPAHVKWPDVFDAISTRAASGTFLDNMFEKPANIKESTRSEIPNITYITRRRTAGRNHIIGFVWYAPDAA